MKKIGTITFHSSYNYGSCLQAYGLQEFIKQICPKDYSYNIINLRTTVQKDFYTNYWNKKGIKNYIKKILFFKEKKELIKKDELFENFINNYLDITKEFKSLDKNVKEIQFDYYISGSDQLWNLNCFDFNWAYFLEFVNKGKKISYAASFGPIKKNYSDAEKERIKKDLLDYDFLSVREQGSLDNIKKLINKDAVINIDPTILLDKRKWEKIIDKKPIIKEKYIFFYNLKSNKDIKTIVKKIQRKYNLPVIVSNCMSKYDLFGFKRKFDIGPIEFLNLIYNAELVLSSSFHGNVFSILFHKNFYAINGDTDFRIKTLLSKTYLENRIVNLSNIDKVLNNQNKKINYSKVDNLLEDERKKSKEYLEKALDIKRKE